MIEGVKDRGGGHHLRSCLAVYGWLGALGAWSSSKEANRTERLVYLLVAGVFTVLAAGCWYALAFVDRPLG